MFKWVKQLKLPQEAILMDSWLYIFKSMPALAVAYFVGKLIPLQYLDSISLLLGVMYSLEAVNRFGFRSAKDQILASSLGGLSTGLLIIAMNYQVNALTLALGIGMTIYLSLLINYRMVSPSALFTSIYMTQLLRFNSLGQADVFLTLAIRLSSLIIGIIIAMIFNVVYSKLFYKKMSDKRLEFVKRQVVIGLKKAKEVYMHRVAYQGQSSCLAAAFNDIELVKADLEGLMAEKEKKVSEIERLGLKHQIQRLVALKNILHLTYDGLYRWEIGENKANSDHIYVLNKIIEGLEEIDYSKHIIPEVLEIELPRTLMGDLSRDTENAKWMALHFQELA